MLQFRARLLDDVAAIVARDSFFVQGVDWLAVDDESLRACAVRLEFIDNAVASCACDKQRQEEWMRMARACRDLFVVQAQLDYPEHTMDEFRNIIERAYGRIPSENEYSKLSMAYHKTFDGMPWKFSSNNSKKPKRPKKWINGEQRW